MKNSKLLFLLSFAIFSLNTFAQTVPNGSFEAWNTINGVETPIGWIASQELNCTPISSSKITDNVDSTFALLLESSTCLFSGGLHEGYALGFFPLTTRVLYLNGFYKSVRTNTDSAQITIDVKNGGTLIGSGKLNIFSNVSSYTALSIPITYTSTAAPTNAELFIKTDRPGFSTLGNKLWIDQLSFSNTATSLTSNQLTQNNLQAYPNPFNNKIVIEFKGAGNHAYTVQNTVGVQVEKGSLKNGLNQIDLSELSKGIYFIQLLDNVSQPIKIVKQ